MHTIDRSRRRLAISAAALAGYVDAVGFLSADRYFASFMSGNTTRLGVDLVIARQTATIPGLLIAGFVLGVFGGAVIAAKAGRQRKFAVLASVAALLGLAAGSNRTDWTLALLVLAMGALNNTFQKDGEVSVGLTYMTGALVRLGQGLAARIMGQDGKGWGGWLALWLGLAAGAVAGAYMFTTRPDWALLLSAGYAAVLALAARRLARS